MKVTGAAPNQLGKMSGRGAKRRTGFKFLRGQSAFATHGTGRGSWGGAASIHELAESLSQSLKPQRSPGLSCAVKALGFLTTAELLGLN